LENAWAAINGNSMSDDGKPGSEVREGQRIAKVIARAGLCSRRDAEAWIAAGRVSVNGKVLASPAYNVTDADDVRVDGQRLGAPERTRLFLFHKPRGLVTTARDPEGRPTISDALPPDLPRLVAVGRLDINTEGLLLLTNDGGLARVLELPATGWLRRYRVRAHGTIDQAKLDSLAGGVTVDRIDYAGIEASLDREQGSNAWITMGLREGKNREIKIVLEHLGLAVNRLIRVSFGPFELGDLTEGEVAEVRTRVLRDQLGVKLANQAGVDFEAPIVDRRTPLEAPHADEPRREGRRPREASGRGRAADARRSGSDDERGKTVGAAGPRRAPSAPSTPERRRKHVSALRAEIAAEWTDAAAPRKRIERSSTHDRKGRTVAVERFKPTAEELARRAGAQSRGRGAPKEPSPGHDEEKRPRRRSGAFDPRGKRDSAPRERSPRSEAKRDGARSEFRSRGPGAVGRDGAPGQRNFERTQGRSRDRIAGGEPRSDYKERQPRAEFKPRGPREPGESERRNGAPRQRKFEQNGDRSFDRPNGRGERPRSGGRPLGKGPPKGPPTGPPRGPRRPPRKP
jgi:23S rRNA pseudouridine2605 synthase